MLVRPPARIGPDPTSPKDAIRAGSGGNQQKAVVARELSRPVRLLIASQPTRGVYVGSTELIHRKIVEARDAGAEGALTYRPAAR